MANIRATTTVSATRSRPALGEANVDAILIAQVGRVEPRAPPALRYREDEPVVVGPAVSFRLGVEEPQERPYDDPVELGVYARAQLLPRLHGLHAGAPGLVQNHGGVGLRHGEYSGFERYPRAAQLVGIPPAVGALVMPPDPGGHLFELGYRGERLFATRRMLGQPALGDGVELACREEQFLRQPEQTDVVQQTGHPQPPHTSLVQLHLAGQIRRVRRRGRRVAVRVPIPRAEVPDHHGPERR